MRQAHAALGALFVLVFLSTGGYMRATFPELYEGDPTARMLYRSAHVYILLSSLANGLVGALLTEPVRGWRRIVRGAGSLALLAAPPTFTVAFFLEPAPERLDRPIVLTGAVLMILGVLGFAISATRRAAPGH